MKLNFLLALAATLLANAPLIADEPDHGNYQSQTTHSGVFNGKTVEYVATYGQTIIANEEGEPTASIFSTDYVAASQPAPAERPVIFLWQGGPSAPTSWIHVNGFGPRVVVTPQEGDDATPEFRDNPATLLDVADLVFVDPAGTGFSRILAAGSVDYFTTATGDAESMTHFVANWLKARGREASPVYLAGTSYGSVRIALMASYFVQNELPLAGLILLSQGANLVETTQRANNLVGYASNISQLAAVAWYHGRTAHQDKTVYQLIDEAYAFSMNEYLAAIARGTTLPEADKAQVAETLSGYTGISEAFLLERDLLINKFQFRNELLKDQGLALTSDGRETVKVDAEPSQGGMPTLAPLHHYLAEELKVTLDFEEFAAFAEGSGFDWDYVGSSTLRPGGADVEPGSPRSVFADYDWPGDIAEAFNAFDDFRILIATGVYDMLTTTGPARLLASNVRFPPERIAVREYEGGHSFYSEEKGFARLADDVRELLSKP